MSQDNVVLFEDIEDVKENIKPLKKGRKVLQLQTIIKQKQETVSDAFLETKHIEFRQKITQYQGDDPLNPWISYIGWIQEAYISRSRHISSPVIEKCIEIFQNNEKYKNDIRFLKICIVYADNTTDADEIFSFLQANNIGVFHSLFYRAYSLYLFSVKNFTKCIAVLETGIKQNAYPQYQLKADLVSFQAKIDKFKEKKARSSDIGDSADEASFQSEKRNVLGNSSVIFSAMPSVTSAAPVVSENYHESRNNNQVNNNINPNIQLLSTHTAPSLSQTFTSHGSLGPSLAYETLRNIYATTGLGYNTGRKHSSNPDSQQKNKQNMNNQNNFLVYEDRSLTSSHNRTLDEDQTTQPTSNIKSLNATSTTTTPSLVDTNPHIDTNTADTLDDNDIHITSQKVEDIPTKSTLIPISTLTSDHDNKAPQSHYILGQPPKPNVYTDVSDLHPISSSTETLNDPKTRPIGFGWNRLASRESRSKENTMQAMRWDVSGGLNTYNPENVENKEIRQQSTFNNNQLNNNTNENNSPNNPNTGDEGDDSDEAIDWAGSTVQKMMTRNKKAANNQIYADKMEFTKPQTSHSNLQPFTNSSKTNSSLQSSSGLSNTSGLSGMSSLSSLSGVSGMYNSSRNMTASSNTSKSFGLQSLGIPTSRNLSTSNPSSMNPMSMNRSSTQLGSMGMMGSLKRPFDTNIHSFGTELHVTKKARTTDSSFQIFEDE